MSFKAQLKIGGKEFDVLHCSYSFRRDVDAKGRPSSGLYGGQVTLEVESTEDTSLLEAMVNNAHKAQKGTVTFFKRDEDKAKMRELEVEDGYISQYSEALDYIGAPPMTSSLVISAPQPNGWNADDKN